MAAASHSQVFISVARPRKLDMPVMSVMVVSRIDDAVAGSRLSAVSKIGIIAPAVAARSIDTTIEQPMTVARPGLPLQTNTALAVTAAIAPPLASAAMTSFE